MFQEPKNYTDNDHFFFEADKDLEKVCNAPKDKDGVFKVLELRNGKINLVYIGYSNSGGLFNEIVNGVHSDKNPTVQIPTLSVQRSNAKGQIHYVKIYKSPFKMLTCTSQSQRGKWFKNKEHRLTISDLVF